MCCRAIDDKPEQAAQLCHEMLSASPHAIAKGPEQLGRDNPERGQMGSGGRNPGVASSLGISSVDAGSEIGRSASKHFVPRAGIGALDGEFMNGDGEGGKVARVDRLSPVDGFATSAKVGQGVKRHRPAPSEMPSNAETSTGGVYSSISDLIHVSMTVWVGAAILVLASALLLVKR